MTTGPNAEDNKRKRPSLAEAHPELAAQWDYEKNLDTTPHDVAPGSDKKVWWRCPEPDCGHGWKATLRNRASNNSGCPACAGKTVTATNSLAAKRPDVAAQWDHDRNVSLTPHAVTAGSAKRAWWRCPEPRCGHSWETSVNARTSGTGCPVCAYRRRHPTRQDANGNPVRRRSWKPDITETHPRIAAEWDHERNEIEPTDVTHGSRIKAWWRCSVEDCGHRWRATVASRTRGAGCPKCRWRPASGQSLADKRPEIAAQWDDERNATKPQHVMPGSVKKIWWRCPVTGCGHRWQATVASRTRGKGCPACARGLDAAAENLAVMHPEHVEDWDDERNGLTRPEDIIRGSQRQVWWRCSTCDHRWRTTARQKVAASCPKCGYRRRNRTGQDTDQKPMTGRRPGRGTMRT